MKIYKFRGKKTIQNPEIPNRPGVYFLWSKKELLYIGTSKNVRLRIAAHQSRGFLNEHIVNPEDVKFVSIIETVDEFEGLRLENQLIKLFKPKNNKEPFYQMYGYSEWRKGKRPFIEKTPEELLKISEIESEWTRSLIEDSD